MSAAAAMESPVAPFDPTELHVFDFDGTLFRSPEPNAATLGGDEMRQWTIGAPVSGCGLGWFQHPLSLGAAVGVPEVPAPRPAWPTVEQVAARTAPVSPMRCVTTCDPHEPTCYVSESVSALLAARARGHPVVVLTGREKWFLSRITGLLRAAGIVPQAVPAPDASLRLEGDPAPADEGAYPPYFAMSGPAIVCKHQPQLGTVRFKVAEILHRVNWIVAATTSGTGTSGATTQQTLRRIHIYDDRDEQLGRIAHSLRQELHGSGIEVLERHVNAAPAYPDAALTDAFVKQLIKDQAPHMEVPAAFAHMAPHLRVRSDVRSGGGRGGHGGRGGRGGGSGGHRGGYRGHSGR